MGGGTQATELGDVIESTIRARWVARHDSQLFPTVLADVDSGLPRNYDNRVTISRSMRKSCVLSLTRTHPVVGGEKSDSAPIFFVDTHIATLVSPISIANAPVAQLDRALVYGTKGRRFESCWARYLGGILAAASALACWTCGS